MTGKGLHMSDLMILFAGSITEVDARSKRRVLTADLDDTTIMLIGFASGATATLATLTATADMFRLQVFGSKGWAALEGHDRLRLALIGESERLIDFPSVDIERAELEAFADAVAAGAPFPVTRKEARKISLSWKRSAAPLPLPGRPRSDKLELQRCQRMRGLHGIAC